MLNLLQLFGAGVRSSGIAEQYHIYEEAYQFNIIGCITMTELSHGAMLLVSELQQPLTKKHRLYY